MHPQVIIDKPAADEGSRLITADVPIEKARAESAAMRYRKGETITRYFEADGKLHIVRKQDVTDVMEACKARHNNGAFGHKETRHLAMIPESVVEKYCFTRGVSLREFIRDKNHMKAILNDPDLRNFRIYPGRV